MITDNWVLLALFCGFGSFALWADKHTAFGKKIGATNIALIAGLVMVNIKLVPAWSDVHALAFSHAVPIGISLCLFQADLRSIVKLGPKLLLSFFLGAFGTTIGAFVAMFVFNLGPESWKIYGMYAATYIGGSANLAAVGNGLGLSAELYAPVNAADVIIFFFWMMFLVSAGTWKWLKSFYPKYDDVEMVQIQADLDAAESAEKSKLAYDAPLALGIATVVSAIGVAVGKLVPIPSILITTTIMLVLANTTKIKRIEVAEDLGFWLFMVFFVAIGAIAPFSEVAVAGASIFLGASTLIVVHGVVLLVLGKVFKLPLEYLLVSSSANVGGPSTAGPLAVGYGWHSLVGAGVLLGILGAAVGTYAGFAIAYALRSLAGM